MIDTLPTEAAHGESASDPLVRHVSDWLIAQALADGDVSSIVMGCSERLQAAGIALARTYIVLPTLHPLHRAVGIVWQEGGSTTVTGYPHIPGGVSDAYLRSPHYFMKERNLDLMRVRLEAERSNLRFPILEELRADGMTDYLAFEMDFRAMGEGATTGMLGSFACDRKGGFTASEIAALIHIRGRLAVAVRSAFKSELMRNIAHTYLGPETGAHVLSGQIQRGDGEGVTAVIWYSDLRGSTRLADTLSSQDYIDTLNAYYDVTGGAIHEAGGEILSFIGDGLLAIFQPVPSQSSTADTAGLSDAACRAAVAAGTARQRLKALNGERAAAGLQPLEYGTALHCGEVHYGNVGVPDRLTFSVFGAAVNEAQRIEQLTKTLGKPILMSDRFAAINAKHACSLGRHELPGVSRTVELHGLKGLDDLDALGLALDPQVGKPNQDTPSTGTTQTERGRATDKAQRPPRPARPKQAPSKSVA